MAATGAGLQILALFSIIFTDYTLSWSWYVAAGGSGLQILALFCIISTRRPTSYSLFHAAGAKSKDQQQYQMVSKKDLYL